MPLNVQARRPTPLSLLDEQRFDVLIVGGGLYGVSIARQAAGCGLRVALVEKRGIAAGASGCTAERLGWNEASSTWSKLSEIRRIANERMHLVRSAPPSVRLLPWLETIETQTLVARIRARVLDRLVSAFPAPDSPRWPPARLIESKAAQVLLPGVEVPTDRNLRLTHEAVADVCRLSELISHVAARLGATILTRCEAISVDESSLGNGSARVVLRDTLTAEAVRVETRCIVLSAGIETDRLRRTLGWETDDLLDRCRLRHEMVLRRTIDAGLGLGRHAEMLPARRSAILVTDHEAPYEQMLSSIFGLGAPKIESVRSLRYAVMKKKKADLHFGDGSLAAEERHGVLCLSVVGGSAVYHRAAGRAVAHRLASVLDAEGSAERVPPLLPGGDMSSVEGEIAAVRGRGLSFEQAEWLVRRYGSLWKNLLGTTHHPPETLGASPIPLACEIGWAIEHEGVRCLADMMMSWRVPELGVDEERLLDDAAAAMARYLRWNGGRMQREIARWHRERDRPGPDVDRR